MSHVADAMLKRFGSRSGQGRGKAIPEDRAACALSWAAAKVGGEDIGMTEQTSVLLHLVGRDDSILQTGECQSCELARGILDWRPLYCSRDTLGCQDWERSTVVGW